MKEGLTMKDFERAKAALEKAHIPGPYVFSDGAIKNLEKLMEEMANKPREEMGKRQSGEKGKYEIQREEMVRNRLEKLTGEFNAIPGTPVAPTL